MFFLYEYNIVDTGEFSREGERAGREKTFYGGTAGFMGGAFGAAVMGMGLLTGAGAVAAAGVGIGYAATLAATRNAIMGVGEQFPNAL